MTTDLGATVRIDKWLWAARFFKTRSLALDAIRLGQVDINGTRPKPSRGVRIGDEIQVQRGNDLYVVQVCDLAEKRGSAAVAQTLYQEDPTGRRNREDAAALRSAAYASNPVPPPTRPDKHARGKIRQFRGK